MNAAAQHTLYALPDIILGYGHSDEYSFVFHKSTTLFERRSAKIASTVVSTFTAAYVHLWSSFFSSTVAAEAIGTSSGDQYSASARSDTEATTLNLAYLPTFDARCIAYPSIRNLKDYISWRQADCHINNLYNTTFWTLVLKGGMSNTEAEEFLKGTLSSDKNEILWSRFKINYNNERELFKKGSVVLRAYQLEDISDSAATDGRLSSTLLLDNGFAEEQETSKTQKEKNKKAKQKAKIIVEHVDLIRDEFWLRRPWLISGIPGRPIAD